jgi:putative transposase
MTASLQGKLSVERMCALAEVSRAGFYRCVRAEQPEAEEIAVRAAIQEVAIEHHRNYGYRRIAAELRIHDKPGKKESRGHCHIEDREQMGC